MQWNDLPAALLELETGIRVGAYEVGAKPETGIETSTETGNARAPRRCGCESSSALRHEFKCSCAHPGSYRAVAVSHRTFLSLSDSRRMRPLDATGQP